MKIFQSFSLDTACFLIRFQPSLLPDHFYFHLRVIEKKETGQEEDTEREVQDYKAGEDCLKVMSVERSLLRSSS